MSRLSALALAATLALSASCATAPWVPDAGARAPRLDGYGAVDFPITTTSPEAQEFFRRGVLQAYAFNEAEAVRAFKAALAFDPRCAMCAWGVAWKLGPHINAPQRGDLTDARRHIGHALAHAQAATPRERALIDAMALRYGVGRPATPAAVPEPPADAVCGRGGGAKAADPLDIAYAAALRELADRHPLDAEVVTLYAEAEMVATRDDTWWSRTGQPSGRIGEVAARLERALTAQRDHTGLNHYLIHAADAVAVAPRAAAAADRLGTLAPAAPHLVHMSAHTYVHLGRYADATRVNQRAVALDAERADQLKAQGFEPTRAWIPHNEHFLWYAALMEGRAELALATARQRAERNAKLDHPFGEYLRALPLLTLLRFERWAEVLAEPAPQGSKHVASTLGAHARGVALSRLGRSDEAAQVLADVERAAAAALTATSGNADTDELVRAGARSSLERLRAEVALARGRLTEAVEHQQRALDAAGKLDAAEPPLHAAGARLVLGEMQLRAGQADAAARSYAEHLAEHPDNGWALRGALRVASAQGRDAERLALQERLRRAWPQADAAVSVR